MPQAARGVCVKAIGLNQPQLEEAFAALKAAPDRQMVTQWIIRSGIRNGGCSLPIEYLLKYFPVLAARLRRIGHRNRNILIGHVKRFCDVD